MSDLMIIECKNCGRAYKGRIDRPFLCPKCIEDGVTLEEPKPEKAHEPVIETKNEVEPIKNIVEEKSNFDITEEKITGVNPIPPKNNPDIEMLNEKIDRLENEVLELSQFIHKIFR